MKPTSDLIPRHGRLWLIFGLAVSGAFFILGFFGREVYRQAPPIPSEVRTTDGRLLMTREDILTGQTVWQSTGASSSGRFGVMAHTRRPTGRPTGCIARRRLFSISGAPLATVCRSHNSTTSNGPACRRG